MKTKRLAFIGVSLLLALLAGAGGVYWAATRVPEFYRFALENEPSAEIRKKEARQFTRRTTQLTSRISRSGRWSATFTQRQINSWLAEELEHKYARYVPDGVEAPRVHFAEDWIHVGFRYRDAHYDGVVSLKVRPWVPQPNVLAVEIESVRAGLLPIPLDHVLREVAAEFEREGFRTQRRSHAGNDVLVLHLDRGRPDRSVLESITVRDSVVGLEGTTKPKGGASHSGE